MHAGRERKWERVSVREGERQSEIVCICVYIYDFDGHIRNNFRVKWLLTKLCVYSILYEAEPPTPKLWFSFDIPYHFFFLCLDRHYFIGRQRYNRINRRMNDWVASWSSTSSLSSHKSKMHVHNDTMRWTKKGDGDWLVIYLISFHTLMEKSILNDSTRICFFFLYHRFERM